MPRIAVGVEYDGTAYAGWQSQPAVPTIQRVLEEAVGRVAGEPVELICAGRTDAGVHARAQVAHFDTNAIRTSRAWVLGSNSNLPNDISVAWALPVPAHFHARYSAEARTYRYVIFNRSVRSALVANRAAWIYRPLDHERMQAAANLLIGEHDFSAFRAAECQARSPIRRLMRLDVERDGDWVTIDAKANAFLHHMVRNLAGLLIAIGQGDAEPAWAKEVLDSRDRTRAPATAPANGLYFWGVDYPDAFGLPPQGALGAPGSRSAMIPALPASRG